MPSEPTYRDPRFVALEADPAYQKYVADREKAGVRKATGAELVKVINDSRWTTPYARLMEKHGIAPGELEFEPSTWPSPATLGEMEQRLTRLIGLGDSTAKLWRENIGGDRPSTDQHADYARCVAKMVHGMGVDATNALLRIKPQMTADQAHGIFLELRGLVLTAMKPSPPQVDSIGDKLDGLAGRLDGLAATIQRNQKPGKGRPPKDAQADDRLIEAYMRDNEGAEKISRREWCKRKHIDFKKTFVPAYNRYHKRHRSTV